MDSLRIAPVDSIPALIPCCRCALSERRWDRVAGKAYCPNCQELLAQGQIDPLVEPTERNRCAVCNKTGTVCFHTFPLQSTTPVAIDLCPQHLRCLLGRCLDAHAFNQLRRQLSAVGLSVGDLFLLHAAFYDGRGRALQPAVAES
jgi:hypothetical protein